MPDPMNIATDALRIATKSKIGLRDFTIRKPADARRGPVPAVGVRMIRSIVVAMFACCVLLSCNRDRNATPAAPTTERPSSGTVGSTSSDVAPDAPEVTPRQAVEELGRRMKEVSTLAPPDVAAATIRRTYSGLVTAELLDRWATEPATAPGRQVSSPWPERIEVENVSEEANGKVVVTGVIVEVTSTGEAARVPVRLTVDRVASGWLVSDYRVEALASEDATEQSMF